MSAFIQDHGSSVNPGRQEGPHAHILITDAGDKFAFGCDLGLDKVMIFKFDPAEGTLVAADPAFAPVKAGAGARHIAFHPNGRWAYVITEMASTITAFSYDGANGKLAEFQTESTLPKDYAGRSTCAEVAVHPSGNCVYGSNRGDDSIAVFSCDPVTGRLSFVERDPTGGKTPRQFEIDPTGAYMLVGNQDSGAVVVFRIDQATWPFAAHGKRGAKQRSRMREVPPPTVSGPPSGRGYNGSALYSTARVALLPACSVTRFSATLPDSMQTIR